MAKFYAQDLRTQRMSLKKLFAASSDALRPCDGGVLELFGVLAGGPSVASRRGNACHKQGVFGKPVDPRKKVSRLDPFLPSLGNIKEIGLLWGLTPLASPSPRMGGAPTSRIGAPATFR
jgi:hypothetical protein